MKKKQKKVPQKSPKNVLYMLTVIQKFDAAVLANFESHRYKEQKIMKNFLSCLVLKILKPFIALRYRLEIKGFEKLSSWDALKKGGVLILSNHPAGFIDTVIALLSIQEVLKPHIVGADIPSRHPILNALLKIYKFIPIPFFNYASNSIKRKRATEALNKVKDLLKKGDSVLVYPSGKSKICGYEEIGGKSGVHQILQDNPDINILLIRIRGLWGSSFSRAGMDNSGSEVPSIIFKGIKSLLKSMIFLMPKRKLEVEFFIPSDFPTLGSRLEINQYLEQWYNQGYAEKGEPLNRVPYSFWPNKQQEAIKDREKEFSEPSEIKISLSEAQQDLITKEVSRISKVPTSKISLKSKLSSDLGLDSIDIAELSAFLSEQFRVEEIPIWKLDTMSHLMEFASRGVSTSEKEVLKKIEEKAPETWFKKKKRHVVSIPQGETLQEVFLNNCALHAQNPACADERMGVLTFEQMRLRVLLLAQKIAKIPGERIGIMLPASTAANITIFATLLAGKTPVMINWTLGPRHLETVVAESAIQSVLSSWNFIDHLKNVEFGPLDHMMIMLEDLTSQITFKDKLKALWIAQQTTQDILNKFPKNLSSHGVILFTSGTEGHPKGVPLSHKNILSAIKGVVKLWEFDCEDVGLNILPPFHSFGFTVATCLPLLSGIRSASFPNPTVGKQIANTIHKWQCTTIPLIPLFLKGIIETGKAEQLASIQEVMLGGDKASDSLQQQIQQLIPHAKILNGYGITECASAMTFVPRKETPLKKGVGTPLPCLELRIVHHETYAPCLPYQEGLILCRGESVFNGYLNPHAHNPFIMLEGKQWYHTGDLGFLDADNSLTLSGRLKRFTKIGGEMVSLAAIEQAIQEIAQRENWLLPKELPGFVVTARESEIKPELLLHAVCPVELSSVNQGLKAAGFSNLVRLAEVRHIKEIPLLGTGKVNYRELCSSLTKERS